MNNMETDRRPARSILQCGSPLPLFAGAKAGRVSKACRGLVALLVFLNTAIIARAQSYSIDWFTLDGGGGASTGGFYAVSGTFGQPDAGRHSGGSYTLDGGFWGITQTPAAPFLSITKVGGVVTVSWPKPADGFLLDQTGALASPPAAIAWSQVAFPYQTNATHISVSVPMPGGSRFYRLRRP